MFLKPRKNNPFLFLSLLAVFLTMASGGALAAPGDEEARSIPIQNNGRIKAFDSFSRQTVEVVTGKEAWGKRPAVETVLDLLADESKIADKKWIHAGYPALRKELGLTPEGHHFSYNEIFPALAKIESLMKAAAEKRDHEKPVTKLETEAEALYARLVAVKLLITGESIRVIPPMRADETAWGSPFQFASLRSSEFKVLLRKRQENDEAGYRQAVERWIETTHQNTAGEHRQSVLLEVFYSGFRPFQWAWVFYLAAFALLSALRRFRACQTAGLVLASSALALHTAGLILRVLILSRPPVSNMYESMVYMNWVVMVLAVVFWLISRNLAFLVAGSALSALVMIYGNLLPIDANLEVLVPVLRSNYWLTIHVMTIVSSYGAFGLAMALGHRHLFLSVRGRLSKMQGEDSARLIDRVIQVGVLLLGIGTVLGGVWANESWGRFWGWDPKETWALITFLAYLIVVHLRFAKKLGPYGLAVCSVLGFLFVLMTWYGVNFVLGRGLHSYGFGSGGMDWILYYLAGEAVFLGLVLTKKAGPARKV